MTQTRGERPLRWRKIRCVLPLALLLTLGLAGCGLSPLAAHPGGGPTSHQAQTPAASPVPTESPTPTPTPTPVPAASPPAGTAVSGWEPSLPACTSAQLTVTASWVPGAGGHRGDTLHFTNRSGGACGLTGYPGVAVLGAGGEQLIQATRTLGGYLGGMRSEGPIPVVQLAPGQGAAAMIEWIENPQEGQTTCPSYTSILVTPPNTYQSTELKLATRMYFCARLEIHPVLPGDNGWSG